MKITEYRLNQNIEKKIRKIKKKIADLKRQDDASLSGAIGHLQELLQQAESERYYVAHTRYATPEEWGRIDDIRHALSRDGGDPDRPLKTFLDRGGDSGLARNKARALCIVMDRRAQKAFSKKGKSGLLAEYNELGKMRDGDSDRYDGYLRKEEWLIKKGLWPVYM